MNGLKFEKKMKEYNLNFLISHLKSSLTLHCRRTVNKNLIEIINQYERDLSFIDFNSKLIMLTSFIEKAVPRIQLM